MWREGPVIRGEIIEKALGQNLPQTFPVVDRFHKGIATSIKSLDLNAVTYQNSSKLKSILHRYVDKVAGFNGGEIGQRLIKTNQILGRSLDLAVPHAGTATQRTILREVQSYATSQGVKLNVIVIP